MGIRKCSRQTHQHYFEGILLVLIFLKEATEPRLERTSSDQSITTLSRSSQLTSSVDPLSDEAEAFDCYRSFLAKAKGAALGLCKMAATMHCLATN